MHPNFSPENPAAQICEIFAKKKLSRRLTPSTMPPKASLKRRWSYAGRRSYKGTTYRRKTYRRPSYKRRYVARKRYMGRKGTMKKGGAVGALRRTRAYSRYVNVSRSIKTETGLFKLVTRKTSTSILGQVQAVHTPWIKNYNFLQNSTESGNLTGFVPGAIGLPTPPGLFTKVYNLFVNTRVLCSRLTVKVTRTDGVDISPWRVCLAPVNAFDYSQYVTGATQYTTAPVWQPTGAGTPGAQFDSLTMVRGARVKTMGPAAAPGGNTPARVVLSSTVMQTTMNLDPAARTDAKYNETPTSGISANPDGNWWIFSIHSADPTGAGTTEFTLEIQQTWWIKAWQPYTPYIVASKKVDAEGKEAKEAKTRSEEEDEEKEMDVALEDFQDLSLAAPGPPAAAAPPPSLTPTPAAAAAPARPMMPPPAALKRSSANAASMVKK